MNSGRSTAAAISSMFWRNLTFVKIEQETREKPKPGVEKFLELYFYNCFENFDGGVDIFVHKKCCDASIFGFSNVTKKKENPSLFLGQNLEKVIFFGQMLGLAVAEVGGGQLGPPLYF